MLYRRSQAGQGAPCRKRTRCLFWGCSLISPVWLGTRLQRRRSGHPFSWTIAVCPPTVLGPLWMLCMQITTQWSRRLCLQENLDKLWLSFLALSGAGRFSIGVCRERKRLRSGSSVSAWGSVVDKLLCPPRGKGPLMQALCRGRRLRWLPVSLCTRRRLWRQLVSSTFSRGWLTFRSLASGRVKTARLTGWPSRLLCSGMQSVLRIFSVFLKVIMAIRCSVELPICGVFGRPASDSG